MSRFVLLAFVIACGSEQAPLADTETQLYRIDRPCINSVVGGDLQSGAWGEIVIVHGCANNTIETFQYGPDLHGVIGTEFPFRFELAGINPGGIVGIEGGRMTAFIARSAPLIRFEHNLDDLTIADVNGDGTPDWVTAGGGVRRADFTFNQVPAASENVLLTHDAKFIAVADVGGSSLPDLVYVTPTGTIGLAIQTAPDVFTDETLASDPGTPCRLAVGDVDGDGRADVVGAAGHVFVYSSKRSALLRLDEPAQAVAIGDFDGDSSSEPVFITADRAAVRRVVVGDTLASEALLAAGGDAMAVMDMEGDYRSDIVLVHDAGTAASWLQLHRAFVSF